MELVLMYVKGEGNDLVSSCLVQANVILETPTALTSPTYLRYSTVCKMAMTRGSGQTMRVRKITTGSPAYSDTLGNS